MMDSISLGFVGDVMMGRGVNRIQENRKPKSVWGDIFYKLKSLDGIFINLEYCISNRGSLWRNPPHVFYFRASPDWSVKALKKVGVDWCNLANNHILDYGEEVLFYTINNLKQSEIKYSGAGENKEKAFRTSNVKINNLDIVFISFSDHPKEYSAGEKNPGIAYINKYENEEERGYIKEVLNKAKKNNPDILVASGHLGPNMVESPSQEIKNFVYFLIENGVDIFYGHSAHIFQEIEIYKNKPILYDTGDFLDYYRVNPKLRNDLSFIFKFEIINKEIKEIELIPIEIKNCTTNLASKDSSRWCIKRMKNISKNINKKLQTKVVQIEVLGSIGQE